MSTISSSMRPDGYAHRSATSEPSAAPAAEPGSDPTAEVGATDDAAPSANETAASGDEAATPQQSLQQQTDRAYQTYADARAALAAQSTVPSDQRAALGADAQTAKKTLDQAVAREIGSKLDAAYATQARGADYSTNVLVTSYGNNILARHASDPQARSALTESVAAYRKTAGADATDIARDAIAKAEADPNASSQQRLVALSSALVSQPREVVSAALQDPRVRQWATDTAGAIAEPYNAAIPPGMESEAPAAAVESARRLRDSTQGLAPEIASLVIDKSLPTIEKIGALDASQHSVDVGQAFAMLGETLDASRGDATAQATVTAAADAYMRGFLQSNPGMLFASRDAGVDRSNALATNLDFTKALAQSARDAGRPEIADNIITQAATDVREIMQYGVTADFDKAHDAVAAADRELGMLLARSAPLTQQQMQSFIEAYRRRPEVAGVYQAESQAASQLMAYMRDHQEMLVFAAANSPEAARYLGDMMKGALEAGQGELVFDLADAITADPAALATFDAASPGLADSLLSDAMVAMASTYIAQHGGDTSSALDELATRLGDRAKNVLAVDAMKQAFAEMKQLRPGDLTSASRIAEQFRDAGKLSKSMAVGMGAVTVLVCGFNGLSSDQIDQVVGSLSTSLGAGADLTAKAAQYLSRTGKLSLSTATTEAASRFAARTLPVFNAITATTSFASDVQNLAETRDPAYAVAVAGDIMGFVGALTMANPVGMAALGIGMALSVIGGWFGASNQERQEEARLDSLQHELMDAAGVSKQVQTAIDRADQRTVTDLLRMGITPTQLQELAAQDPDLFDPYASGGANVSAAAYKAVSAGLSGNEFYGMLRDAASANPGDPAGSIRAVLGAMAASTFGSNTREDCVDSLRQQAELAMSPSAQAALERAAAFLENHSASQWPGMAHE